MYNENGDIKATFEHLQIMFAVVVVVAIIIFQVQLSQAHIRMLVKKYGKIRRNLALRFQALHSAHIHKINRLANDIRFVPIRLCVAKKKLRMYLQCIKWRECHQFTNTPVSVTC